MIVLQMMSYIHHQKSRASVRWCWWESLRPVITIDGDTTAGDMDGLDGMVKTCMSSHKFQVEHIPILKNATWIDLDK